MIDFLNHDDAILNKRGIPKRKGMLRLRWFKLSKGNTYSTHYEGYIIVSPSPFSEKFAIQHFKCPEIIYFDTLPECIHFIESQLGPR